MENKEEIIKLFNQRKYKDVINKITTNQDLDLMFLKAICYGFNNDFKSAEDYIKQNEEILNKDLGKLIDTHLNLCFYFNKLEEAKNALEHYENYPYVSQEVEEKYREYRKLILTKSKSKTNYSKDDIIELLKSNNEEKIQKALTLLNDYKIDIFIPYLEEIMLNFKKESLRTLCLLFLNENKYDRLIKFNYHGKILNIIPSDIEPINKNKIYNDLLNKAKNTNNPQFFELFKSIITLYYLYYFPCQIKEDEKDLLLAINMVCNEYLNINNIDSIKDNKIKNLCLQIKNIVDNF